MITSRSSSVEYLHYKLQSEFSFQLHSCCSCECKISPCTVFAVVDFLSLLKLVSFLCIGSFKGKWIALNLFLPALRMRLPPRCLFIPAFIEHGRLFTAYFPTFTAHSALLEAKVAPLYWPNLDGFSLDVFHFILSWSEGKNLSFLCNGTHVKDFQKWSQILLRGSFPDIMVLFFLRPKSNSKLYTNFSPIQILCPYCMNSFFRSLSWHSLKIGSFHLPTHSHDTHRIFFFFEDPFLNWN